MGRGDRRTKRGKIFRGSFGKSRPKQKEKKIEVQVEQPVQVSEEKEETTTEEK